MAIQKLPLLELPECREYPELQQRVFANAYFSKQKVKVKEQSIQVVNELRVRSIAPISLPLLRITDTHARAEYSGRERSQKSSLLHPYLSAPSAHTARFLPHFHWTSVPFRASRLTCAHKKGRTVESFMGVEIKHFRNIQTF